MVWLDDLDVACQECKRAALSGLGSPLRAHCTHLQHKVVIYVCEACGYFWEVNAREARPITSAQVAKYCVAAKSLP